MLLLGFWVSTVVVVPRLSLILADNIRSAPSVYELEAEKYAIKHVQAEKSREAEDEWKEENLSPGQEWWDNPETEEAYRLAWKKIRWEVAIAPTRLQHGRLEEAFRNRYNAYLGLAVALARFSPAFAFNNATVRLAGTGLDRQRRFLAAFKQYYLQHEDWFIETVDRDRLRRARPEKYGEYKWDVSDMPRFTYQETWPEEDVRIALVDIGVLAVWGWFSLWEPM